jgi:hypothetical protein
MIDLFGEVTPKKSEQHAAALALSVDTRVESSSRYWRCYQVIIPSIPGGGTIPKISSAFIGLKIGFVVNILQSKDKLFTIEHLHCNRGVKSTAALH